MDVITTYYIAKYNHLVEQIAKLKHENALLEDLSVATGGSGVNRQYQSGSGISTSTPGSPPTPPPTYDPNNDGTVDGADLGLFLTNWNPTSGADFGVMLSNWSQPSGPTDPSGPTNPNPTNPEEDLYPGWNVRGTSTKDIASLARQRSNYHI